MTRSNSRKLEIIYVIVIMNSGAKTGRELGCCCTLDVLLSSLEHIFLSVQPLVYMQNMCVVSIKIVPSPFYPMHVGMWQVIVYIITKELDEYQNNMKLACLLDRGWQSCWKKCFINFSEQWCPYECNDFYEGAKSSLTLSLPSSKNSFSQPS